MRHLPRVCLWLDHVSLYHLLKTIEEVIPINIGQNIRCLRQKSGFTQKELATKLCVSVAAISRWENNVCYPDITLLPVIAGILDTSIDELFSYQPKLHTRRERMNIRLMKQPVLIMNQYQKVSNQSL